MPYREQYADRSDAPRPLTWRRAWQKLWGFVCASSLHSHFPLPMNEPTAAENLIKAIPLIATKYNGRTIAGIKGQDEADMWNEDSTLWGQPIEAKRIKQMQGDTAEDLDRFVGDCGMDFASDEVAEQYDAFCQGRLIE